MKRFVILFLLLFCLGAVFSSAQSRTGTLTGLVVDDQGMALPGVEVSVSSPNLIAPHLSRVSNDRGFFRFPYLPPGTYTLKASLQGFKVFTMEGIILELGLTTNIDITLVATRIEETITVISEAPIMSVENTKLSTNIKADELKDLPIRRDLFEVVALAPGVIGDNYLGGRNKENAFHVDGVQMTNPGTGSGLGATQSLDAYDEIQIETGGHPAEYGNASGVLINVITKSGGNEYHGELSLFYQNDDLQSSNIKGTGLSAGTTETVYDVETNFSLGGPILKDKLWFFLSAGYNPSKMRILDFPEEVPYTNFTPLGKLTFQPNSSHRFNLSFNFNSRNTPYQGASRYRPPEVCQKLDSHSYYYNFSWMYTVSSNTIIEVLAAHLFRTDNQLARGQGALYLDLISYMASGSNYSSLSEVLRWQAKASVTHYVNDLAGDHEWKLGFEYERGESRLATNFGSDEYGMNWYYTYLGRLFYAIQYIPPVQDLMIDPYDQYSAYLQDSWRINKYINFNVGLRFNYIDAYTPPQAEQTKKIPITSWYDWEPRISAGFDPFGDGKTGIKVSWSTYAARMWTWYTELNPNGQDYYQYRVLAPGMFLPLQYMTPSQFEIDPDLKRPSVHEIFFSVDRTIGKDFVIKLSYVDRRFKNFITLIDSNYTPDLFSPYEVTNLVTGEPMTIYYKDPTAQDPSDYYNNDPKAKRHYRAFMVEIVKRLSRNYQFRFNYTWSRLTGTNYTSSTLSGSMYWNYPTNLFPQGILSGDRTHVIKLTGIWYAPYGFVLSTNYTGSSGAPYARWFRTPVPPYFQSSLFMGEPMGSQRLPFLHYFDVRLGKDFHFGEKKLSVFVEGYNILNLNQTTEIYDTINNPLYEYGDILGIQSARILQLGVRFVF